MDMQSINIDFNFYSDTPPNQDPDAHSPSLRRYHKLLWSKPLPNGQQFQLIDTHPKTYLYHQSNLGEFFLTSDAITHSYRNWTRLAHILEHVPKDDVNSLFDHGSTIGAYTIFPGNKIDNKMTINSTRGIKPQIYDRFDITLECIRLYYHNIENPLTDVLQRYSNFFALFVDFKGYVDFFFFQDLVSNNYTEVKFHIPHKSFDESPLPSSLEEYLQYKNNTIKFIKSRAKRMTELL